MSQKTVAGACTKLTHHTSLYRGQKLREGQEEGWRNTERSHGKVKEVCLMSDPHKGFKIWPSGVVVYINERRSSRDSS